MSIQEIVAKRLKTQEEILRLFGNGVRMVIDDHDGLRKPIKGYVVLDTAFVCPIYPDENFSLNSMYVEDGRIHISKASTGNAMEARLFQSFETCVEDYNTNPYGDMIVAFHIF